MVGGINGNKARGELGNKKMKKKEKCEKPTQVQVDLCTRIQKRKGESLGTAVATFKYKKVGDREIATGDVTIKTKSELEIDQVLFLYTKECAWKIRITNRYSNNGTYKARVIEVIEIK